MKHFLPSTVMLIPFVVKHYSEESSDDEVSCDPDSTQNVDSELNLSANNEVPVEKKTAKKQPKKE